MAGSLRKRNRYFLLALAVLPQLISLSGLAGLFWLIRIKEVFSGTGAFSSNRQVVLLLSAADRKKLTVGSLVHGATADAVSGQPLVEFSATVTKIAASTKDVATPTYQVTADIQHLATSPEGKALLKSAQPINFQMWTRTRRALLVLWQEKNHQTPEPTGNFSKAGAYE